MPRRPSRRPTRARRPRPPLGQHFLADAGIRRRLLARLDSRPEDCWLEIGAGHGEMTLGLAERGRLVAAVERDPELAATLRTRLADFPGARVLEADILKVSLPALGEELGCKRWRVYGNLPYYITSPILQHLFAHAATIADIHVVVQREVAERLAARPGGRDYGYLSVLAQFHAAVEVVETIPRGAFRPPPQVESALVRLVPPGEQATLGLEEPTNFLRFVGTCFRQKRKTLLNNLRGLYGAERMEAALATAGLEARVRAEELPLEAFARVFRLLPRLCGFVVGPEPL